MPGDARRVSKAFDRVVAGADDAMWIVTTVADGRRAGCLVGFGAQVSIEPRRFLACLSTANYTYAAASRAQYLAVHLLASESVALAQLFGAETGSEIDKFEHCEWHEGPHSLPILAGAAGWFAGEVLRRYDFGDHVGHLLAPIAAQPPDPGHSPLRFHEVGELIPGHLP